MKHSTVGYAAAGDRLRTQFRASCSSGAARAGTIVTRDVALLRREITVGDTAVNGSLGRRPRRGPPFFLIQARAQRTVARDLAQLRGLARGC